jgi:hypothetical protein
MLFFVYFLSINPRQFVELIKELFFMPIISTQEL